MQGINPTTLHTLHVFAWIFLLMAIINTIILCKISISIYETYVKIKRNNKRAHKLENTLVNLKVELEKIKVILPPNSNE